MVKKRGRDIIREQRVERPDGVLIAVFDFDKKDRVYPVVDFEAAAREEGDWERIAYELAKVTDLSPEEAYEALFKDAGHEDWRK